MPPARPYWKGHMRLSLVSFGVRLYPAISTASKITFHQIARDAGARIREQKVVPGVGEVDKEDIVRGYEYEKGRYVIVTDDDLETIKLETKKTIELIQFFAADQMDPLYVDKPYFALPDGPVAEEAFAVVREAMVRADKVGLGRVVLSGRERLVAVMPRDKGFAMATLHAFDVMRKPAQMFDEVRIPKIDEDEVTVATELINRKTAAFDPSKFVDRYQEALRELIKEKIAGQEPEVIAEEPAPAKVINLMDALKRSLRQEEPAAAEAAPSGKGGKRKKAGK
ncbi:MAG: Ku protein [Rhodospirillales bacterium]|nr:Ku protein [Rhodospirillales bacterium]